MTDDLLASTQMPNVDRLVAGAVVHRESEILVLRRAKSDAFLPGIEELPSGGCDDGESLADGLWRELHEEIGLPVPTASLDAGFVEVFDYVTDSGQAARQYTFSLPLSDVEIRLSDEHTDWRWLRRSDLADCDMTDESKAVAAAWWRWSERAGRAR